VGRLGGAPLNAFTIAATALLAGFVPLGWVALRSRPIDGLVALELAGTLAALTFLCLAAGLDRSFEYSVAVVAAVLSWIGGLVFARFLGRWL
jgi:multisubunit Na+/H+ antiporter MnhF subunit